MQKLFGLAKKTLFSLTSSSTETVNPDRVETTAEGIGWPSTASVGQVTLGFMENIENGAEERDNLLEVSSGQDADDVGTEDLLPLVFRVTASHEVNLSSMIKDPNNAVSSAHSAGLLFSSRPVTLLLCKWWFRIFVFITGVLALFLGARLALAFTECENAKNSPQGPCRVVFKDEEATKVRSLGLMADGWPVPGSETPVDITAAGQAVLIQVSQPCVWDGLFYSIAAEDVDESQPSLWMKLEVFQMDEEKTGAEPSWKLVQTVEPNTQESDSSELYFEHSQFCEEHVYRVSFQKPNRCRISAMDLIDWEMGLGFGVIGIGLVLMATVSRQNLFGAKLVFAFGLFMRSVDSMIREPDGGGTSARIFSIVGLYAMIFVLVFERMTFELGLVYAIGITTQNLIFWVQLHDSSASHNSLYRAVIGGMVPGAILAYLLWLRRQTLGKAAALMQKDSDNYSIALGEFINSDRDAMARLRQRTESFCSTQPAGHPRQQTWYVKRESVGLAGAESTYPSVLAASHSSTTSEPRSRSGSFRRSEESFVSHSSVMINLAEEKRLRQAKSPDQLYISAIFAHFLLKMYLCKVALRNNGCFPASIHDRNISWSEAIHDPGLESEILWPAPKHRKRIVEKVLRTYQGDLSKVLDIARGSIVFRTVADMLSCFEDMTSDPSVEVLRVKNKLSGPDGSTGGAFTGIRNLHINLRLRTAVATRMGVDTHICEVQLVPAPVNRVKSEEGHRNYIIFRNLRAE